MRRIEVDMRQQMLGGQIGLTFQQLERYEKGTNRIGASRLQQIGKILKVPVSYFFRGFCCAAACEIPTMVRIAAHARTDRWNPDCITLLPKQPMRLRFYF